MAIPTIQEFGATTEDVQWVVTAYALASGGRRRIARPCQCPRCRELDKNDIFRQ